MAYDANVPVDNLIISAIPGAIREKGVEVKNIIDAHTSDTTDAHAASAITNVAQGNISSTTVQEAINELDTKKVPATDVATEAGANKILKLNATAKLPADITGNAATATILALTRKIAGANFNGDSDIDISYANLTNKPTIPPNYDLGHLLASNGYQKFENGLVIQWGTVFGINDTNTAVTFPVPFSTAVLCALASLNFAFSTGNDAGCGTNAWTTTGMNVRNGSSVNGNVCWIAIGY
ncbi:MAG: hypothetical protein H6Q66_279 [Firmicutes bacterium]|nr:hypothetical protein [Bacillota bacterium]